MTGRARRRKIALPPCITESVDLREFFHAIAPHDPRPNALREEPADRPMPKTPAELLDRENSEVCARPLEPAAAVDGIQSALHVKSRDHRPVHLVYTAAGSVSPATYLPIGLEERLFLLASEQDRQWIDQVRGQIPAIDIAESDPTEVERGSWQALGDIRDQLEDVHVKDLLAKMPGQHLLLDGSLVGRPVDHRLLGVVKTTKRRYLADESPLLTLPEGHRSPRFLIKAGTAGSGVDRFSAYVRLNSAIGGFDRGLIRVESFDPALLEPLAAFCIAHRQGPSAADDRWDRHLAVVRRVEDFLRARRSNVFGLRW